MTLTMYGVNALSDLYLIATVRKENDMKQDEAEVSMPSRACTSLLQELCRRTSKKYNDVSMPSRACTSLLQYPFKNLGFMRFLEPVFAGIYQNILTVAYFHAC